MAEGIQSVAAARLTSPAPAQAQASCCGPANATGAKKQPSTRGSDFGDMIAWAREAMASAMGKGGAADRNGVGRIRQPAGAEKAGAEKAGADQRPSELKQGVGRGAEAGDKPGRASDRGSTWIPDHVSGVLPSALATAIQRAGQSDGDGTDRSRTLPTTGTGRLRRPSTLPADRPSTLPADRPSTLPADRPLAPHVVLPSVLPTTLPVVDRRRSGNDR